MQNFGLDALSTDWWTDSPENTINSPDFHWGMENLALTANTFILQYVGFSLIIFPCLFNYFLIYFFLPFLGLTPLKFYVSASLSCGVFWFVLFCFFQVKRFVYPSRSDLKLCSVGVTQAGGVSLVLVMGWHQDIEMEHVEVLQAPGGLVLREACRKYIESKGQVWTTWRYLFVACFAVWLSCNYSAPCEWLLILCKSVRLGREGKVPTGFVEINLR